MFAVPPVSVQPLTSDGTGTGANVGALSASTKAQEEERIASAKSMLYNAYLKALG